MDREQAHRLWQATLALRPLGTQPETFEALGALWRQAGVADADQARLLAALSAEQGSLERRELVVREMRRLIRAAGFEPDLLSTPAAGMRGL